MGEVNFNKGDEKQKKRDEILAEINALDQLMQAQDYIGIKIAMGRASKEDYVGEIALSEQWARRKDELNETLKQIMEDNDGTIQQ